MRISGWARTKAILEIVAVFAALFAAAALIGPISALLPEGLATPVKALALWGAIGAGALLLRRAGSGYGALGLRRPASWRSTLGWAAAGLLIAGLGSIALGEIIRHATGWPPLDVAYIRSSIEGDTLSWIVWMLLVVWGSAAFGEELLSRGFVMDRLWTAAGRGRAGLAVAALLQAAIFGALHAVQGPTGVVLTGFIGLVFAGIYFASGRNLWAPILAHGAADTISLTLIYAGLPLPGYIA